MEFGLWTRRKPEDYHTKIYKEKKANNFKVLKMDSSKPLAKNHPIQEIDTKTDTRDYLAHARKYAQQKGFADWFIVDVDAHHVETVSYLK